MASYQTRQRDPLLDSATQAALEKRSKELVGFGLGLLGLLIALIVGSYSPDDPSWISATDAPVQNLLGHFGASIAAPLMMVVGLGIWVVPVLLIAWSARFILHRGQDRAIGRIIFAPIAIVVGAVYAATLTPGADWPANFGLGGLFGDTVLGVILTIVLFGAVFGVKFLSFMAAAALVVLMAFALGFTRPELRVAGRFLMLGTVMLYATLLKLVGKGAVLSAKAAHGMNTNIQAYRASAAERRAVDFDDAAEELIEDEVPAASTPDFKARAAAVVRARPAMPIAEPRVSGDTPKMPPAPPLTASRTLDVPAPAPEPVEQSTQPSGGSFLSGLLKRNDTMPEPELVTPEAIAPIAPLATDSERVSSRIANAIKAREIPPSPTGVRIEPALTAGRGPRPLVFADREEPSVEQVAAVAPEPMPEAGSVPAPILERAPIADLEPMPEFDDEDTSNPMMDAAPYVAAPHMPIPTAHVPVAPTTEPRAVVQHPPKRAPQPSRQAKAEAQPALAFDEKYADYEHPPLNLLMNPIDIQRHHLSDDALEQNARMLESVLDDYGVKGEITSVRPGPVVTMYELEPAPGLKASRVIGLADDIARSMSALAARVSTVPGRTVIGIELPNENREKVVLREILSHRDFGDGNQKLPLALGKDIGGEPIVANLAKMPHLLIAGTTGSGKSVAINTMILSLLYKLTPEECRMIMIDPKMLELSVYDGIPHLLSPVVTDPKKAVVALKWVVGEMEERYRKMSKMGVRNIDGYNGRVKDALSKNEMFSRTVQTGFDDETGDPIFETEESTPEVLPYIVVIVDEMADLMMVAGKEIEACIQRLAQMARASGIHLIMATQRPSVDVITGTIKANFPTRISFQVTSKIDSRTILGEMGAEQLLGMGDMLYMAGGSKITRVHGPFVSDEEVEEIVNHLKGFGPPEYMSGVVEGPPDDQGSSIDLVLGLGDGSDSENALYDTAVAIVIKDRKCSTSYIQRKLAIGYNKAARLVEQMEDEGVVSSANHVGKREILVPEQH
ncbi:DNA translocase FtsK 4TM domain-containing protein [Yoonia sp. I 8.24]|uniref:DNA translocase FtsK n=1 Tax=Yoonia sp. I 8.24 TaxID=1537229 RepID=UPI001EDD203B|nr:DNA translocase FtsK 4TM domain-containing protein [Yoonia sp. I 8.24]MCG3269244.1 DNA translocase FtsK 4TM domain-containing protein [Yoonia sp. I 8.24]